VILRGGKSAPNYSAQDVATTLALLQRAGLAERVMIDLSHDNSGKQPEHQPAVVGTMVESFLVGGRQDLTPGSPLTYGQSITDGCLDWDTTVQVLDHLAV